MAASDNLNGIQFQYQSPSDAEDEFGRAHGVLAMHNDRRVGDMHWNSRVGITSISVDPEFQRRGLATAMWHEGHRLAGAGGRIPAPKHSNDRTDDGDAWARAVGGRLPRRVN